MWRGGSCSPMIVLQGWVCLCKVAYRLTNRFNIFLKYKQISLTATYSEAVCESVSECGADIVGTLVTLKIFS